MSIYVMSDLHGRYDLYQKMLEEIQFKDTDTLYLLGDVVDRGPNGIKIILDLTNRKNVKMTLGNHDLNAKRLLSLRETPMTDSERKEYLRDLALWKYDGGLPTIREYERCSPEERQKVLAFLDNRGVYSKLTVNGQKYVLSHTLPRHFPGQNVLDADAIRFVCGKTEYEKCYADDVKFITGHTPTSTIDPQYEGKIWRGNGHIAIDCGAVYFGTLGCIRLDDEKRVLRSRLIAKKAESF